MSSKLVKNTSLYTIGNILPKAATFLLLPLYTRYLTPADYGIVNSMNVLLTILTIFFTMAIERSIYRLYYDYKTEKDKKDYLGTVFITMSLNAFCVLTFVIIGKGLISKIYISIPFNPYYLYIIGTGFFSVFGLIPRIYYQVEEKAGKFILISLSEFFVSTILIIYFIVYAGKGASGMLFAQLLRTLIFLPLYIFILTKIINFTFRKDIMKESFVFSIPLVPMILSAWILNLSDRIFIERYFTLKDVGIYSIAYKMAEILLIFTTAFNKAYDPLFYKIANQGNQMEAKHKLFKYNKIFSLIIIIVALGISLFSKEFILLLDAKYRLAYKLVPIIMIGILFGQIGGLFNRSIYQEKKTKLIMSLALGAAIINIFLNSILVPDYGSYGAAYATTLTFFIFFLMKYFFSKKCYFIAFAWKELGLYLLISVIIVSIFYFTSISIWLSILLKTVIMLSFIALIFYKYKEAIFKLLPSKK